MRNTIRIQLLLLIGLFTVLTMAFLGGILVYSFGQSEQANTAAFKQAMYSRYDSQVKSAVQIMAALVSDTYNTHAFPSEAARLAACYELIREGRYLDDRSGYFWADSYAGWNVARGDKPELENQSRWETKDPSGFLLIQAIIAKGQLPGGGFTNYQFTKPGQGDKWFPKRSYSLAVPELGIVIGTGNYTDDIDHEVARYAETIRKQSGDILYLVIAAVVLSILITAFMLFLFNNRILGELVAMTRALKKLAGPDADLRLQLPVHGNNEMAEAAQNFNQFVQTMHDIMHAFSADIDKVEADSTRIMQALKQVDEEIATLNGAARELAKSGELSASASSGMKSLVGSVTKLSLSISDIIDSARRRNALLRDSVGEIRRFRVSHEPNWSKPSPDGSDYQV